MLAGLGVVYSCEVLLIFPIYHLSSTIYHLSSTVQVEEVLYKYLFIMKICGFDRPLSTESLLSPVYSSEAGRCMRKTMLHIPT